MSGRFEGLLETWRGEADLYRRRGQGSLAEAIDSYADDLERALRALDSEALDLAEAEAESGYSAEHLGRLVREGILPNAGQKGAPRILRGHLPRKPGHGVGMAPGIRLAPSSTLQIARSVVNSGGGHDG